MNGNLRQRAFLNDNQQEFFNTVQTEFIRLATKAGYQATNDKIKDGRFVYEYGLREGSNEIGVVVVREGKFSLLGDEPAAPLDSYQFPLQVLNADNGTMNLTCEDKDALGFAAFLLDEFKSDRNRNFVS